MLFLYDFLAISNWVLILSIRIIIGSPTPGKLRVVEIFKNYYISRASLSKAYYSAIVNDGTVKPSYNEPGFNEYPVLTKSYRPTN